MSSRRWLLTGVAVMLGSASGCGLLCDRYCDRMYDRCERLYSHGCCAPPPAPACPPGCQPLPALTAPAPQGSYYNGQ